MKSVSRNLFRITAVLGLLTATMAPGAEQSPFVTTKPDVSFRHELEHSIDRGLAWLRASGK